VEVCFLDVGQGSASVILLGQQRAILIDCGGRQSRTVLTLLQRYQISSIARLVVTHNHADHSAGAVDIRNAYRGRIDHVWLLYDAVLTSSQFWNRIREDVAAGHLSDEQIYRLERRQKPTQIYNADGVLLTVIAPSMMTNVLATQAANPNATSGVLVLKHAGEKVVFAGDSTIWEWQAIIRQRFNRAVRCRLLTVPHHAGIVWEGKQAGETDAVFAARIRADLDWLYRDAINAEYGIVSLGTTNNHGHPRTEVIDAFRRNGGTIFCTQMTDQCDPDLESQRRRALPIVLPSRSVSSPPAKKRRGGNVACGSTLLVEITANGIDLQRLRDHQTAVDRVPLVTGTRPICRR
jgi:competence protein ComEC